jgi:diguanylate cyclase
MTPIKLARLALTHLSKTQIPPTPENFRRAYDEIAGTKSDNHDLVLQPALMRVLTSLGRERPECSRAASEISVLVQRQDTGNLEKRLSKLLHAETDEDGRVDWAILLRYLLRQIDATHTGLTYASKMEALDHLLSNAKHNPSQLGLKIQSLLASWGEGQAGTEVAEGDIVDDVAESVPEHSRASILQFPASATADSSYAEALSWRDMLIRTINLVVLPQFADNPGASGRIVKLLDQAAACRNIDDIDELGDALKSTLHRAELQIDSQRRMHEGLLQMLRLLVASMGELTLEDKWLHGQIAIVQEIISKPFDLDDVYNAESSLKELIHKQSSLKPGLAKAKDVIKGMMSSFIGRLAEITESTGTYQAKIKGYQTQILATDDTSQLNAVLEGLVSDISTMSAEAQQTHQAFRETQQRAEAAEKQINELTTKLEYISETAHQDFLTGALNRRGMDEAIEREFKRADRHNTPISLAMLDIDHFKKINDTMGHSTGDVALAHLAKVVKGVLRGTDVLARYGGEEFVILLPGTRQDDAVKVITGVQRDLTKNFFLHNNERVLITFSAGVAERRAGEQVDEVLPRADAALYEAKHSGRNRVIGATVTDLQNES